MNHKSDALDTSRPAGGQTVRLPGSTRSAALHDQLYRYAEDLQQMVERNGEIETHYETLRESSERLIESREELDALVRSSRDIHIVTSADGTILQSNPAGAALAPLHRLTGRKLDDRVLPSHRETFLSLQSDAIEGIESSEPGREMHLRREGDDDAPLIVSAQALAVRKDGEVRYLHWILRDVTQQRETEFETQISTMVFKHADEGVMITDIGGVILVVNPAFCRITGYSADEVVGQTPHVLSSGKHDAAFYTEFWQALREKGSWQGEIFNRRKNGDIYPEWLTVSAARAADGSILSYIAVFTDLSRLLQAEKRLSYLAHHDSLTGLPNRLLFQDRLAQTLAQAKRSGIQFTLIFIDLDNFKPINDTLGHAVGDQVLQEAANRLSDSVRECDTVARLGGDEFVILAPGLVGDTNIGGLCNKMIDALRQPIQVEGEEVFIGGSFGCAEYPNHGDDEAVLLKCADAAMYKAKAAGGNSYVICDDGIVSLTTLKGNSWSQY
jgi:diguanylate cyclase (GGDEF)-like protein/PAS domain S-box-containing protein